jgi:hypothetical protein
MADAGMGDSSSQPKGKSKRELAKAAKLANAKGKEHKSKEHKVRGDQLQDSSWLKPQVISPFDDLQQVWQTIKDPAQQRAAIAEGE